MRSALPLIWDAAGRPDPVPSAAALLAEEPGVCALCAGHHDVTAPVARALGTNWVDRSCFHAPSSGRVCPGCLWSASGKPPATIRMWTVISSDGPLGVESADKAFLRGRPRIALVSRGQSTAVAAALTTPPPGDWVVSVAVSGQKHVAPYARINHGQGPWTIRYETADVTSTPEDFARVRGAALALRRAGVRADDILQGTPGLPTPDRLQTWRDHSPTLAPHTRTQLLDLALWTITKADLT